MGLSLKQRAIEESGALTGQPFNDIFEVLGVSDPTSTIRSPMRTPKKDNPHPNAGGIFATEGVEEMKYSSMRSPIRNSPRTVALRLTDAVGNSNVYTTPNRARREKELKDDHWEAWKEIQIQNDQMQQLEEQLQRACLLTNLNHQQVLATLDQGLA